MEKTEGSEIVVLLATYNGGSYVLEQLESLRGQNYSNFDVLIRDDGSVDNTVEICSSFKGLNISIVPANTKLGPKENFLELLRMAQDYKFYFFADQDDVWFSDKISKAKAILEISEGPTLYCSNVYKWFSNGKIEATNFPIPEIPLSIFENSAMGCTMAFNKQARDLILKAADACSNVFMHDWFSLIVILLKGKVVFDSRPSLKYRIHKSQVIGYRQNGRLPNFKHIAHSLAQFNSIYKFTGEVGRSRSKSLGSKSRMRSTLLRNLFTLIALGYYRFLQKPIITEFEELMKTSFGS